MCTEMTVTTRVGFATPVHLGPLSTDKLELCPRDQDSQEFGSGSTIETVSQATLASKYNSQEPRKLPDASQTSKQPHNNIIVHLDIIVYLSLGSDLTSIGAAAASASRPSLTARGLPTSSPVELAASIDW